jgi:hypothetical protein
MLYYICWYIVDAWYGTGFGTTHVDDQLQVDGTMTITGLMI